MSSSAGAEAGGEEAAGLDATGGREEEEDAGGVGLGTDGGAGASFSSDLSIGLLLPSDELDAPAAAAAVVEGAGSPSLEPSFTLSVVFLLLSSPSPDFVLSSAVSFLQSSFFSPSFSLFVFSIFCLSCSLR